MLNSKDMSRPNFLHMFGKNGWMWQRYDGWDEDDYNKYKASFLGNYTVDVLAVVSVYKEHVEHHGGLGVLWLEVVGYPDCTRDENNGYSFSDLYDMIDGLITAEENLVRCGIPFIADYRFHGPNSANLKRRNDATRRKLNMEYWEKKYMEEDHEKV